MTISVRDQITRGTAARDAKPGDPLLPKWRSVTFVGAEPKSKIWKSRAMQRQKPTGWGRIRVNSRCNSYVRFTCYDPAAFHLVDDAWIDEMWLKLLLIQE